MALPTTRGGTYRFFIRAHLPSTAIEIPPRSHYFSNRSDLADLTFQFLHDHGDRLLMKLFDGDLHRRRFLRAQIVEIEPKLHLLDDADGGGNVIVPLQDFPLILPGLTPS